jgi:hypothetical protein
MKGDEPLSVQTELDFLQTCIIKFKGKYNFWALYAR